MHLAPVRQDLQQELSTPAPTNPKPEAEQSRPLKSRHWAERYASLSLGLENLLSLDRDKEIAKRAFKQGADSESVEKIIATSPVGWTQDETRLIASLVLSHLEQSRSQEQHRAATHQAMAEPSPTSVQAPDGYLEKEEIKAGGSTQKRSSHLPQITDSQLVAAERRVNLYFQAAPTNPTDQQLTIALERHQNKLTTATTANQEYRRKEQELESAASIVEKLLPSYQDKRKEAAKLAARFRSATEALERTQSELNQLEQQRRTFSQWQASPQTREMERLRDYLNTKEAQTRLKEIKAQQRELERQQKPSREIGRGLHL